MCGIYGVIDLKDTVAPGQLLLENMGQAVVHRGPDDVGAYFGKGMAFGMRRLSIIDLTGGHQPISNEDGTVWAVCNGEIYNFRELRSSLEKRGHKFSCNSDTEVLVHLYEEEGLKLFQRLRGMFGMAIWDASRSRLVLARDRLGQKPLYIYKDANRFLFASEIKSILAADGVSRQLDYRALQEYLALGFVPAPLTLFDGIEKVLPGHYVVIENGRVFEQAYWDVSFDKIDTHTEEEWIDQIRAKILEAVQVRLVSDVPLGAFLSGGVDSSAIVAAMAQLTEQPVKTYSIGFEGEAEEQFYNELPYARLVADAFGTDHHEIIVRPDVKDLLPKLIWHMEEPIADSAFITTYLVSQLARESVTVILSGVGGDEFFGGYRRYLGDRLMSYYQWLPGLLRTQWLPAVFAKLPQDRHSSLANYIRYLNAFVNAAELNPSGRYMSYVSVFSPEARAQLLEDQRRQVGSRYVAPPSALMQERFEKCRAADSLNQMLYVDIKTSLVDNILMLTDKMSMAVSLECRAPLVDHELLELTSRMPPHLKIRGLSMKYILKHALKPWLPDEIIRRKKRGFGAPMGAWLRKDLEGLIHELLAETQIKKRGLFQWETVQQMISDHRARRKDYTDHLLTLINFELWHRTFLDNKI